MTLLNLCPIGFLLCDSVGCWALLKLFLLSTVKIAAAYPFFVGVMYGLFQAGKDTDFAADYPQLSQHLVDFINLLLAILVEHWLGWLIFSALLGALWTFLVAEPRQSSKLEFDRQRQDKLP